jgi:hypothetical protein
MKNTLTTAKCVAVISLLFLGGASILHAADEITGLWEARMDFGGRESFAELSISKNPDGSLSAKWGSDELSDVKFRDGKLTFTRTVGRGDRQFTSNFEATLSEGKLTGKMTSNMGEYNVVCTRPKPMSPAVGRWNMRIKLDDADIEALLTISQNADGILSGQWANEPGEHVISDVNYHDGRLTFNRHVKLAGPEPNMVFEFDTPFQGTIEGNKLTGMMKNEMGQWQVTGTRVGAALIGKWEMTTTSDRGTRTHVLTIYPDLTGRYESFGGQIPIKDLKLEGDTVTFGIDMGFGDRAFQMDFKGTLQGDSLTGTFTSPRGEQPVTGKKIVPAAAAPPAFTPSEKKSD